MAFRKLPNDVRRLDPALMTHGFEAVLSVDYPSMLKRFTANNTRILFAVVDIFIVLYTSDNRNNITCAFALRLRPS